jgi:trimeric autotransporter adhesin
MTYESALIAQADLRKLRGSTIERKQMSTKTIYKRIALVAVASLGFGVLTSVSPASAAVTGSQNAFVVRSDDATYASQPGDANTTTAAVTITEGGGAELNGKFIRVTYKATSTSTAIKLTTANIADSAVTALTGGVTLTMDASGTGGISYTASTEAVASTSQNGGTIILKVGRAAVPGIYTLSIDAANTFATAADTANFSKSITVTGAPASISVVGTGTTNTNTVIAGDGTTSYTVSLKDSAANATYLLATERLNVTENGTGLSVTTPGLAVLTNAELGSTQSTMSTTVTLTTASLAAGTYTMTVTPVGLAAGVAAATGSLVYTTTTSRVAAVSIGLTAPTTQLSGSATAVAALPAAAATTVDSNYYTNTTNTSFTFRIKAAAAATGFVQYSVAATGVTTTPAAGNYTAALTVDATASYADITVTTSSVALDGNFVVTAWEDGDGGDPSNTVTYKTPVFSGVKFSNPDASEIAVKVATTTTLQAKATDQYGNAMANQTLYFDIAGRSTTAVFARVTDASGLASVPFADVSTSTTSLTDTVRVDDTSGGQSSGTKIDTITLVYATDISATAITSVGFINGTSGTTYNGTLKADGTTSVTIDAAAAQTAVTDQFYIAATLKNAAGAVVRGLPVVFTVTGGIIEAEADTAATTIAAGKDAVTTVTVYTDSNGVARAAVAVTQH